MRLIGAGLPRSGTLSQKVALEMLGLEPCYHMVNVLGNLDLAPAWRRALDGDVDWDKIFDGCQATVDWPGSFFYRELMETYPDAKVLLSVRDGEAWAKSMRETIWGMFYDDVVMQYVSTARTMIDPAWDSYISMMKEMWERSGLLNDGENTTAEWMASAMERYHEGVKQTVPAERLLVWTASDGWEPICEFLGVPVPDTPFPRLNDGKMFAGRIIDGALLALNAWREHDREAEAEAMSASAQ
jgi:hypothetical protein